MTVIATSPSVEEFVARELGLLPDWLLEALQSVPVVVCDGGEREHAYGLYQGDGAARDDRADRIVIFRDTLLRDFGDDPARLRGEVRDTLLTRSPTISDGARAAFAPSGSEGR